MQSKKSFFMGLGAGVLLMLFVVLGVNTYINRVVWGGGMSPNQKVSQIYDLVSRYSIVPFDRHDMIENMYRGLLAGVGDPYTRYLCLEAQEAFRVRTEGEEFVGIGVRVNMDPADNLLTLVNVFRGSPAHGAGLLPGDKIIAVDGTDVTGRAQQEILAMVTGVAGTSVNIGIFRPYEGKRFEVDIVRARIVVPTVFHELIETENGRTGYIRVEGFERPTYSQFASAIEELLAYGMTSLIVDVRNNPGGLVEAVVNMTNMLVPEGIITYMEEVCGTREYHHATGDYLGLPLVILVNERSASASEVMAGAILDTGAGTLVGAQTFGKGVVQRPHGLRDGTAVILTIAQYFTPNGTFIHDVGLTPHFEVEMEETLSRMIGHLTLEEDVQLQVALRVVQGK